MQEFYSEVSSNPNVRFADVLKQIRKHAFEGSTQGEDSYLAYCFYGDPFAQRATTR
jgi:hypothetical protein